MDTIRTTVFVRGQFLPLVRGWLHGLRAWEVYDEHGQTLLGWVLQESEGRRWGVVRAPQTEEEVYDDILYDFNSRKQALAALAPTKEQ